MPVSVLLSSLASHEVSSMFNTRRNIRGVPLQPTGCADQVETRYIYSENRYMRLIVKRYVDYRQSLSDDSVEQGALADIRSPHQRHDRPIVDRRKIRVWGCIYTLDAIQFPSIRFSFGLESLKIIQITTFCHLLGNSHSGLGSGWEKHRGCAGQGKEAISGSAEPFQPSF
eukprot:1361298-Amorphochlora_amoeboformis.AAC.1